MILSHKAIELIKMISLLVLHMGGLIGYCPFTESTPVTGYDETLSHGVIKCSSRETEDRFKAITPIP